MKKKNSMTIIIAALLLTGIVGVTSAIGMQSALGDNNDNELKIKQGANQDNNCELKNDLDKKGSTDNTFACANVAFNIVCLPDSVCIVPNEEVPYELATPT
jgi:L-cysteine desulfidase